MGHFLVTRHCMVTAMEIVLSQPRHYYLLAHSMEQSHSWEANRSSASQEITGILWKPNVHYRWRIKNQLDATYYFIVLLIGSTCFGYFYAHHQELATMMFSSGQRWVKAYSVKLFLTFGRRVSERLNLSACGNTHMTAHLLPFVFPYSRTPSV
jgi:hypothetical protein